MRLILMLGLVMCTLCTFAQRYDALDEKNGIYLDRENNQIIDENGYHLRVPLPQKYTEVLTDFETLRKCYYGNVSFSPNNVIRKDCVNGDVGTFTFTGGRVCIPRRSCNYYAYVYFDNTFVKSLQFEYNESFNLNGLFSELDLSDVDAPAVENMRFVIYESCYVWRPFGAGGPYYTWKKVLEIQEEVQVVGEGDTYILRDDNVNTELLVQACDLNPTTSEFKICCNPSYTERYKIESFSKTTNSLGTTITLGLSIKKDNVPFSFNISGNYSYNYSFGENITYSSQIDFNAQMGECVYPGYQMYGKRVLVEEYQVDCATGFDILISSTIDTVVTRFLPYECSTEPCNASECNNTSDDIDIDSGSNGGNLKLNEDCTGYLNINTSIGDLSDYTISIEGPDGFASSSADNDGIPLGAYNVNISDSCCDTYDTTVYICNSLTYSPWVINSETGQYCREVTCGLCDTDDPGLATKANSDDEILYMECINPQVGPCSFDVASKMCISQLLVDGQVVGSLTSEPEVVDEYDDFFEECTRRYYCNNTLKHTEESDPTYSDWEYDDFFEECYREVYCSGTPQGEGQEVDAEFDWQYDDFFEECVAIIYCLEDAIDEEETTDPEISWDYDDFFNECEGVVLCEGSAVDETSADPTIVSCTYDDFWELCALQVTCDGSVLFDDEESISGGVIVYTDDGIDYCEVYCCDAPTGEILPCSGIGLRGNKEDLPAITKTVGADILVKPNPVAENLYLEKLPIGQKLSIRISSAATGQEIFRKGLISTSGEIKFDMSTAVDGVYLLEIRTIDGTLLKTEKLIKLK